MIPLLLINFLLSFSSKDCFDCHEVKLKGVHEGIECSDCHSDIKEIPHDVPLKKPECGTCHEEIEKIYKHDIHYILFLKGKKGIPDCKDCHGTHEILSPSDPKSPLHPSRKNIFCTRCHKNVIAPKIYHALKIEEEKCFECHDKKIKEEIKKSVHSFASCNDCHREVKEIPHPEKLPSPECGICHKNEYIEHTRSIHGKAIKEGIEEAAHCYDCHGSHTISKIDENSPVYFKNLPKTCGKCHGKEEIAKKFKIPIKNPYQLYEESVHHYAIIQGKRGATCSDCHGVHDIDVSVSPNSKINKYRIPNTCSKCHEREYKEYTESVHWKGYLVGVEESPVCNDCHSEHRILPPQAPESPVYPLNIPKTCSGCHERYTLIQRYGLSEKRLATFYESYHGLALKAGNLLSANCTSCHGVHLILSSSNPLSSTYPDNLPKTCGGCHPGIKPSAKIHSVHEVVSPVGSMVIDIVRKIYIYLIIITIGGMIIYCFLDFVKKIKENKRHTLLSGKEIIRFNKFERTVHLIHLVSFLVLVYTGFAHHYPEAIWSAWFVKILGGSLRAYLHRIAGSLMIITFLIKVFAMIYTKRGREQFKELIFKIKDIKDALDLLLYNLNIKEEKPKFGRFTFYEKFEYWALVWGTIVMGITGLALWFKENTLSILPKWFIEFFLIIHFYEAILASLAILVWHLYWVVFDPSIYPLNRSMFTGKLPEEIYKEEHPLEFMK